MQMVKIQLVEKNPDLDSIYLTEKRSKFFFIIILYISLNIFILSGSNRIVHKTLY